MRISLAGHAQGLVSNVICADTLKPVVHIRKGGTDGFCAVAAAAVSSLSRSMAHRPEGLRFLCSSVHRSPSQMPRQTPTPPPRSRQRQLTAWRPRPRRLRVRCSQTWQSSALPARPRRQPCWHSRNPWCARLTGRERMFSPSLLLPAASGRLPQAR